MPARGLASLALTLDWAKCNLFLAVGIVRYLATVGGAELTVKVFRRLFVVIVLALFGFNRIVTLDVGHSVSNVSCGGEDGRAGVGEKGGMGSDMEPLQYLKDKCAPRGATGATVFCPHDEAHQHLRLANAATSLGIAFSVIFSFLPRRRPT